MSRDLSEVYTAIKTADAEGRTEDVKKLAAYLDSLPAEEGLDPRDLKSTLGGAAVGATAGAFGVPIARAGMKAASKVNAGVPVVGAFDKVPAERTAFERLIQGGVDPESGTTGRARTTAFNEMTHNIAERAKSQQQVMDELAKKGVIDPRKLATAVDTGGYGATPTGVLARPEAIAAETKAMPMGQKVRQAVSQFPEKAAAFGSGIANYRLPVIGAVGPMVGRGLAGAGAGIQATDAINRYQQGDIPGAVISGIGSMGTAATLMPTLPTKVVGGAIGAGAEALNAYLDYLKSKAQQPQQPEQPQEQQMPVPMAQGGLVGGLNAMYNMPLAGGASLSIGGPQQQPQFNPMVPRMADGGLASIGRETEEEKRRRMMRLGVSAQSMAPMQDRGPGVIPASAMPFSSGMPPGVAARMQLEKSMGPGQARVGASGVGMALPNQQGVKMMPGQVDVGYNMPLGQGNLDISARRDINKQRPGMPQNYAANVNYTLPFAAGGYIKK